MTAWLKELAGKASYDAFVARQAALGGLINVPWIRLDEEEKEYWIVFATGETLSDELYYY